jgi:hypothetical protein
MNDHTERKYLYQHTSQETARVVEDYPWGFRLRTTVRYWIETKPARNGGQRFAKQTINPKTGKWCAIKYSTYSPLSIMFLDENNHVKYTSLDHNSNEDIILKFKDTHLNNLSDYQKETLKEIMAYCEVMKHVTWTVKASPVGPVSIFSKDPMEVEKRKQLALESEERELREKEALRQINRAIGHKMNQITL